MTSSPVNSQPAVATVEKPKEQIKIVYDPKKEKEILGKLEPSFIIDTIGTENPQINPRQTELVVPIRDLRKAVNFLRKKMEIDGYRPFNHQAIIAYQLANEETARITGRDPLFTHPYSIGILKNDPNSPIKLNKRGQQEIITSLGNVKITLVPLSNTKMGLYPEEYDYYRPKIAPYNVSVQFGNQRANIEVYPVVFINGRKKYNQIRPEDFNVVLCAPANRPDYPAQPFEKRDAMPTQLIIYPNFNGDLNFINRWNLTPGNNATALRYTIDYYAKLLNESGNPSVYIPFFDGDIPQEISDIIPFCEIGAPIR